MNLNLAHLTGLGSLSVNDQLMVLEVFWTLKNNMSYCSGYGALAVSKDVPVALGRWSVDGDCCEE